MAQTDNRITPMTEGKPVDGKQDDFDAFNDAGAEAESRGGDHRPIQDNGTQKYNFNVQGQMTGSNDFTKIQDVFAPPGAPDASQEDSAEFSDIGLNEKVEVGQHGNQLQYGIDGPAAGGGLKKNTVT